MDGGKSLTLDASTQHEATTTQQRSVPTQAEGDATAQPQVDKTPVALAKRKNQSDVWLYFTKLRKPDNSLVVPSQAKCNYCNKVYCCDSKTVGTSSLKVHIEDQCVSCPAYKHSKKTKTIQFERNEDGNVKIISVQFDKEASRMYCIRMIIRDELPFSHVEGQGFIDFMRVTQPKFIPPSRRTVARGVMQLYNEDKLRMKNKLKDRRVSLTTDTWTSIQNVNYMVLTSHFIDDEWKMHKRILSFLEIPDHRGKTIGKLVENCLNDWGIEKVFSIVVDNASPNKIAVDYMRDRIGNWKQLLMNGNFLHMRCSCHILNLIVNDGLEWLGTSVEAIRNCVKYIRSSPSRLTNFRKAADAAKVDHKGGIIPLDVCTRWNSTYIMLEVAMKYQDAFVRLEDDDNQFEDYFAERIGGNKREGPPRHDDWAKADMIVKFLKIFYDATLSFSGSNVLTANEPVIWMGTIIQELEDCINGEDELMKTVGSIMKAKFDKYWGNMEDMNKALLLAVVLDPRYKTDYLQYFFSIFEKDEKKVDLMVFQVKEVLLMLYTEYELADPIGKEASEATNRRNGGANNAELVPEDSHSAHSTNLKKFLKMRQEKKVVEIKNEVDKYLNEAAEDPSNKKFCVLQWWKDHSQGYPILSKVARDVLAVPASTVASESAFSLGSRVVDPFRASLTPKMVQALVCTSDWLKAKGFSFFKDPSKAELELYGELEKVEKGESEVTDQQI